MSKQISLNMWVSQIPAAMFASWVERKLVHRSATDICLSGDDKSNTWNYLFQKDGKSDCSSDPKVIKRLKAEGWKEAYKRWSVSEKTMTILQKEVRKWYKEVFAYVNKWLKKNKYIDLRKGSFDGGFCAVPMEDDTTKRWGAPLSGPENKVVQIKEKFGNITVYFSVLTDEENKQIEKFSKEVEKKFDCVCCFV